MMLQPVYGHEPLRRRLAAAVAGHRLPQAIVLDGPRGVGKQRLALWLAQYLVCERRGPHDPCGTCPQCRMALGLAHPDIHWFVPIELSARSSDLDRQIADVEEALGEALQARRDQPLYAPPSGMAAHPMAAIRLLLRRLALTPALGGPRVFIIGDAERLRPQTGIDAAPNALLKALEEPPHHAFFVLTASDPGALLPTIRSRTVTVRVTRVPDSVVAAFAQATTPANATVDATMVSAAEGCPGRIVALRNVDAASASAATAFRAASSRGPWAGYAAALAQTPFEARGAFTAMLDALLEQLRAEARTGRDPRPVAAVIARVLEARTLARGNVNPQLVAAVLSDGLAAGTGGRG
jgi:DNA polymerase-3 subunit delta'